MTICDTTLSVKNKNDSVDAPLRTSIGRSVDVILNAVYLQEQIYLLAHLQRAIQSPAHINAKRGLTPPPVFSHTFGVLPNW